MATTDRADGRRTPPDPDLATSGIFPRQRVLLGPPAFAVHDAKNLACALQAGLDWLMERSQDTDAELHEAAVDMSDTCRALSHLLVEALRDTRSGPSDIVLTVQPVPLSELARDVMRRYRRRAKLQGVELVLEPGEDGTAELDPQLLPRVLDNLMDNALRHAPGSSQVIVHYGRYGENAVFSVSDQGPGIDPSCREEVFEPFHAAGPARGTGLGLTFCRRVVEAHGGFLTVDVGRFGGASFVVSLPAHQKREK